jgi:hypothetical protein
MRALRSKGRGARRAALSVSLALVLTAVAAASAHADSGGVQQLANLPEARGAVSINFIGKTMFVSTFHGLYSYDVRNPGSPRRLGAVALPSWENEDMDVDRRRQLVFVSRDPSGFTTPAVPSKFPYGAVHIFDVSKPGLMKLVNTFLLPAGHTTTCINRCDFIWTAGPGRGVNQPADWGGRPVFGTDVRDPAHPKPCLAPIDTGRNDGKTDYAHDVQVDANGVAWVSGRGGVRGYWTSGRHTNPLTRRKQNATACHPVPYAGGGSPATATPSRFMHNSWRNVRAAARGVPKGHILYATEEHNVLGDEPDCKVAGRFVSYDLAGSFGGQGWRDIARSRFRMKVLDTWTPEGQPGAPDCSVAYQSAHYFTDRGDGVLAQAFYQAGVRFLDVSNPRNIRQIGWWRPLDTAAWAPYWHDGVVYVADFSRGIDVLRFTGSRGHALRAPAVTARAAGLTGDSAFSWLCPVRVPARTPAPRGTVLG